MENITFPLKKRIYFFHVRNQIRVSLTPDSVPGEKINMFSNETLNSRGKLNSRKKRQIRFLIHLFFTWKNESDDFKRQIKVKKNQ